MQVTPPPSRTCVAGPRSGAAPQQGVDHALTSQHHKHGRDVGGVGEGDAVDQRPSLARDVPRVVGQDVAVLHAAWKRLGWGGVGGMRNSKNGAQILLISFMHFM